MICAYYSILFLFADYWRQHFHYLLNASDCDEALKADIMEKNENIQHMIVSTNCASQVIAKLECGKAAGSDGICEFCVDYQIRQDSINRSEKVAHVRDIIEILRNLDKDNKLPLFVIDAVGLAKLPKINAEDICYVSVAEKIAQLSSKLDVLNDVVANNSVRSVKNEHDIQSMEKNYSKYVTNVSSNSNSALSMKCDADGISHMKKGPNSAPPGATSGF